MQELGIKISPDPDDYVTHTHSFMMSPSNVRHDNFAFSCTINFVSFDIRVSLWDISLMGKRNFQNIC